MKDPLKSSAVKGEMAAQLVRIFEELQRIESSFSSPFIALHGSADATCDPEGSKHLYNVAKSEDKTLKVRQFLLTGKKGLSLKKPVFISMVFACNQKNHLFLSFIVRKQDVINQS